MTILRFNYIALILLYIVAITLGFLYNITLGWGISLYALCSIIYYFVLLNIAKSKHEKDKENIQYDRPDIASVIDVFDSLVTNDTSYVHNKYDRTIYSSLVRLYILFNKFDINNIEICYRSIKWKWYSLTSTIFSILILLSFLLSLLSVVEFSFKRFIIKSKTISIYNIFSKFISLSFVFYRPKKC